MKRVLLTGLFVLVAFTSVLAVQFLADEQITVAASAIGFTTTKITASGQPQANLAVCRLETAEVRYSLTSTVPTTTVGTLLEIGDQLVVKGHDVMVLFKAIRTGASSGQLDCTYYTTP